MVCMTQYVRYSMYDGIYDSIYDDMYDGMAMSCCVIIDKSH